MPQPLSRVKKVSSVETGGGVIAQRPNLALLVMEVIAVWSDTEVALGKLLALFMKTDASIAFAIYLKTSTSPETRRNIVKAAANEFLQSRPDDLRLFTRVFAAIKTVRDYRNALAHGIWAVSADLPEALLWSEHGTELTMLQRTRDYIETTPVAERLFDIANEGLMVYRENDLTAGLSDARDAYNAVYYLRLVLEGGANADMIRKNLQALPLIQRTKAPS